MSTYNPDKWVIVKILSESDLYKVAGSWSGSYLHGQSYRVNSGIVKIKLSGKQVRFYGHSGSVYVCNRYSYGATVILASVLQPAIDAGLIKVLSEEEAIEYINNMKNTIHEKK